MLILIKGAEIYGPQRMGVRDLLIAGGRIVGISDRIEFPSGLTGETIHAERKILTPGFIDLHVHLLGGGGEGGFRTRTPEIRLSEIIQAGVTTVVGCLGTDDISRCPEALLAKAMQLEEEGVTTYIYTGSYQFPPPTITGSVRKDLAFIPKVVGVGEIAISDHRSSQPTFEELCRVCAEARVGGMIGGKAGLVHFHVGSGRKGLDLLFRLSQETEIPVTQFLPTHLTRTRELLHESVKFAKIGGNIDLTVKGEDLRFPITTGEAVRTALEQGVECNRITLSSDSNGSMPIFDEKGNIIKLGVASIESLYSEFRTLVKGGLSLEEILTMVTLNPAKRVGIDETKGSIEEGKDADLLIMDADLEIDTVIAKGRLMLHKGERVCKETFEWESRKGGFPGSLLEDEAF